MGSVRVLDKHTAELIAAGEVVERPASVVKELAENSIDAGAKRITIEIKNGGISYIRITDDGCGISREDVPVAFLRHATSKVSDEYDLEAIATLGFRGEALASVCAVSRVELLTRAAGEEAGSRYVIEGGEERFLEEWGCAPGTTIIIRDLFFNTPARAKFLKKDVSEANASAAIVDRLALSHPEIAFKFIRDGKQTLSTPGDGSLRSAIYSVFGRQFSEGLIEVDYTYNGVGVKGFVTSPESARPNRAMQTFFINGRYCRSVTMQTALENAFRGYVMTGRHPACVLGVSMPCSAVDVNVHPAKLEVRFTNEKPIYDSVYYGVKSALTVGEKPPELKLAPDEPEKTETFSLKNEAVPVPMPIETEEKPGPEIKNTFPVFSVPPAPAKPLIMSDYARNARIDIDYSGDPVIVQPECKLPPLEEELIPAAAPAVVEMPPEPVQETIFEHKPETKVIGEVFSTYILLQREDEVIIIDKHAAHERIIYEQLKANECGREPQLLLATVPVTLDKAQYDAILSNIELMESLGFEIDDFGNGILAVRAAPAVLTGCDIEATLSELAESVGFRPGQLSTEKLDSMYHTMACRSAMKAGDLLHKEELDRLVEALESDPGLTHCPHGRPIYITLSKTEIEKKFKRIV